MKQTSWVIGLALLVGLGGCTSVRQADQVTVIDDNLALSMPKTTPRGRPDTAFHSPSKAQQGALTSLSPGYASWYNTYSGINSGQPVSRALSLHSVVKGMADQLLASELNHGKNLPVAITSLANLDDLNNTNWLGQTVSESFIHELQIRHVPVIDYKVTGTIKVMNGGDFVMSRNWQELNKQVPVSRVLTGTMSRTDEGVMLNARIIDMNSGLVEASAVGFVPNSLLIGGLNSLGPVEQQESYLIRYAVPSGYKGRMVEISH